MSACVRCQSADAAESWQEFFASLDLPVELPLGAGPSYCTGCALNPELVVVLGDVQALIASWVRLVHRADPVPAYEAAAREVEALWHALLDEQVAELDQ